MRPLPEYAGPPPDDDWIHPLDAAALRPPLADRAVRVIVVDVGRSPGESALFAQSSPDEVAQGLIDLLRERDRPAAAFVVATPGIGWARALEQGLADATESVILITSALEPWTAAHLDPLLVAIDRRDHAIGQRPTAPLGRVRRWWSNLPWRFLFAVPVRDVHSPCRVHRREALGAIVLQSASGFLDVEILAKATFLTQVIEEVAVPPLASPPVGPIGADLRLIGRHPLFCREPVEPAGPTPPSLPAEDPQGDGERGDRPGG